MLSQTRAFFFALAIAMAFVATQNASADWTDNFDGDLQQEWIFGNVNALQDGASNSFTAGSVGDQLVLTDPVSGLSNGAAVGFGVVGESFTDVLVTGTMNPGNDNFISPVQTLIARSSVGDSTFYAAEVNYSSETLIIFRNDDPATASNLVESDPIDMAFTDDFYLEFKVEGIDLTATLFDMVGGTEISSVTTTDETYVSGQAGVLAFNTFGDNFLSVWDDVSATAIGGNGGGAVCDLDGDGDCDDSDIAGFYSQFGNAGDLDYDNNGTIGSEDIDGWLADGSVANENTLRRGDVDLNGSVTSADLGLLLNNFGATSDVGWGQGDLDGNDSVDSSDLGLLLNNFGHMSASVSAVPEPCGTPMFVMGMLGVLTVLRRKRTS